ncbi:NCLDV major capsid protein [Klosneuvirus KNV1]|uniref:NCLDV major capsid protein n=1 Tax=Klosneuvirus KNV1 TaxID=1977640 RepID=A0A1V0SK99_9VIRU|nr:NCLDV major capsid protein [Klosneuvirus KNV1]
MHIDEVCKYCLKDYDNSDNSDNSDIVYLSCEHYYHQHCLKEWILQCDYFNIASTCPCCRKKIDTTSIEKKFDNIKIKKNVPYLKSELKISNGILESYDGIEFISIIILFDHGINFYSFALYPGEYQPSGTCNFSRIDNANLNLWFNAKSIN